MVSGPVIMLQWMKALVVMIGLLGRNIYCKLCSFQKHIDFRR